jgi:hypothetical protein
VVVENDRTRLSASLQPGLPAGRYVVRWMNVSDEDGDPAAGAFSFYIQKQPSADDLANDRQLESIGAEPETTAPAETPAAGGTASGTAAAPTQSAATPTAAPKARDGGTSNTTLYVIIGVIAAAAVLAAGGFAYVRRGSGG